MRDPSCSRENNAWWKLEFSSEVQVDWITIWNRDKDGEGNARRIDGAEVWFIFDYKGIRFSCHCAEI